MSASTTDRYDVNDAITAHQQRATRMFSANASEFVADYFMATVRFADDPAAKAFHLHHVAQIESARSLLTTQRILVDSSNAREGDADLNLLGGGIASLALTRSACTIIRPDWGKEQYKKLSFHWNSKAHEVPFLATESLLAWITNNDQYEDPGAICVLSPRAMYNPRLGIVFFQWTDSKDAKNYVNALRVAANAATSRFFTPFACAMELVGVPVVGMSIAPVTKLWANWESCQFLRFHLDAICASLRFFFSSFPRGAASNKADSLAAAATQVGSTDPVEREGCRYAFAVGEDARWYILDARPLALRQLHARSMPYGARIPRKEMFGLAGVVSTPYSPNELVLRFKLRAMVEQLINSVATSASGIETAPLLSSLMHSQGIAFGSNIFGLYVSIAEQERQFTNTIQAANRRNAMNQAAQQHAKHFLQCKALALSEMIARVIKRLIKEDWRPALLGRKMKQDLVDATQVNDDATDDIILRDLNAPLKESVNRVIGGIFQVVDTMSLAAMSTMRGAQSGTFTNTDLGFSVTAPAALGRVSKFGSASIELSFFDDLMFMVNDSFVAQVYGHNEDMLAELKAAGCVPTRRIECKLEDIDCGRVLYCLEQMLNISIVTRGAKLVVDPKINFFEPFFDLDSTEKCSLRTQALYTGIDVPLCCVSNKVTEFRNMQERVTAKFQTTIDVNLKSEQVLYLVNVARYMSMYTYDTMIAHRGYAVDDDYDDTKQIPARIPFPTSIASTQANNCFDAAIASRLSHFYAKTDMQRGLKHLLKYTESTRPLFDSPTGTSFAVADKMIILCEICEAFKSPGLIAALDTAIFDISQLLAETTTRNIVAVVTSDVAAPSSITPIADALKPSLAPTRYGELRVQHVAHLLLLPLALLVKHVLMPDPTRPESERIDQALRYCTRRRNIIAEVYGHESVEHGIACNDIASICSNSKHDLDRAQVEFERAVEILEKVQGDGATLQIITNNLAFLFFRKAERLKKMLLTEFSLISASERRLKRAEMLSLLNRAENFLTGVMGHEASLPALDFAAAVNNLASIKLFDGRYKEAKVLFEKTLDITAALQSDRKEELPCRSHAFRNLKVLARRQYLAAVMSVQACIRRFIAKIRSRESFRKTRAIKPIQMLGRGFIVRLFLAKHYRFSGFHSWLRQPRLFSRKLDPTLGTLPLEIRRSAFVALSQAKAVLLHRLMRGHRARRNLGTVFNFCRAHFEVRWFCVVEEIDRRRCVTFMTQMLRWKLLYACEMYLGASTMLTAALRQEQTLRRGLVVLAEQGERVQLVLREERVLRLQHLLQRDRELHVYGLRMRRREVEAVEEAVRCRLCLGHTVQTELVVRPLLQQEEHMFYTRLWCHTQQQRLACLEQTVRSGIVFDAMAKYMPMERLAVLFRVGRGYLWRKWCNAKCYLHEREHYVREAIRTEERMSLNRANLRKQLLVCRLQDVEWRERRLVAKKAMVVYDKLRFRHILPLRYCAFVGHCALLRDERLARWNRIEKPAVREKFVLHGLGQVLGVMATEAIFRNQILQLLEDVRFNAILAQAESDWNMRLHTLHQFWFARCVSDERRGRLAIDLDMQQWHTVHLACPAGYLRIPHQEAAGFAALALQCREAFALTRSLVQHQDHLRDARLMVEIKEQQARMKVVAALQALSRSQISHEYASAHAALLVRAFHGQALSDLVEATHGRALGEKQWYAQHFATRFAQQLLCLQEHMEREALQAGESRVFTESIQRTGQQNLSLVKLRLVGREKHTREALTGVEYPQEVLLLEALAGKMLLYVQHNRSNLLLRPQRAIVVQREAEQRAKLEVSSSRKFIDWIATTFAHAFFEDTARPWLRYTHALLQTELRKRERIARTDLIGVESTTRKVFSCVHSKLWARRAVATEYHMHTAMLRLAANHSIFVRESLIPAFTVILRRRALQFYTSIGRQKQWVASVLLQRTIRGYKARLALARSACFGIERFFEASAAAPASTSSGAALVATPGVSNRVRGAASLFLLQRVGRACLRRAWLYRMLHADAGVVMHAKRTLKHAMRGLVARRRLAVRWDARRLLQRVALGYLARYRLHALSDWLVEVAELEAQGRADITDKWLVKWENIATQSTMFAGNRYLRGRAGRQAGGRPTAAASVPMPPAAAAKGKKRPAAAAAAPPSDKPAPLPGPTRAKSASARTPVVAVVEVESPVVAPPTPILVTAPLRFATPSDPRDTSIVSPSPVVVTPLHFQLSEDGSANIPPNVSPTIHTSGSGGSNNAANGRALNGPSAVSRKKTSSEPLLHHQQHHHPQPGASSSGSLHRHATDPTRELASSVSARLFSAPAWQSSARLFSGPSKGWSSAMVPPPPGPAQPPLTEQVPASWRSFSSSVEGQHGALLGTPPSAPSEPRPVTAPRDRGSVRPSPPDAPRSSRHR